MTPHLALIGYDARHPMQARRSSCRWRCARSRAVLPSDLRLWLTDEGSLTARIRARCDDFSVRVLRQGAGAVLRDECEVLGLRPGRRSLAREVLLMAGGTPVVFARTVLPQIHPRGAWQLLRGIGSRPLGAALFSDPGIERCPLATASLDWRDARYHRAVETGAVAGRPARLWARRSVFRQNGQPLLVTEVFLPAISALYR